MDVELRCERGFWGCFREGGGGEGQSSCGFDQSARAAWFRGGDVGVSGKTRPCGSRGMRGGLACSHVLFALELQLFGLSELLEDFFSFGALS